MMKARNLGIPQEISKHFSFIKMLVIYLLICGAGVSLLLASFDGLIRNNNKKLTGDVCHLVTEKMNNSIGRISGSAENMAALLSAQDHYDLQELYEILSQDSVGSEYVSIGFIDADDHIYASSTELGEFEKWGLLDIARLADPVSISAPYRSGKTGQPVFTMFVDYTYGGGKQGYLFLTYPLKEIQKMAYTESLTGDAEIWLMEADSDNIIQCAGPNRYALGMWDNALIAIRKPIDAKYQKAYEDWKNRMNAGEESAGVTYKIHGETYTQVYSKINFMHGWYVVVRIPDSALSSAIQQFRTSVSIFLGILLIATAVMFVVFHRREAKEKKVLENLSIRDPLTSALNRRAFDFTVDQYLGYLGKTLKNEAALLFMDVDYFKRVNDRFGHEAGDRILTGFSAALKDVFGDEGYISRYGGDEFVVLVRNGDQEQVSRKLELLQKKAAQIRPCDKEEECGDFVLTFSCGAALYPKDADNLNSLKERADDALYIVKENGRNGFGWYRKEKATL